MILRYDNFITERILTKIDNDVDFLYSFFKGDLEEIARTKIITKDMFSKEHIIDSSELTSELSIKSHKLNPCKIYINHKFPNSYGHNFYSPKNSKIPIDRNNSTIGISIHKEAINIILYDYNGSIFKANMDIPNILDEFESYKIRGSIRHELAHWYDDTLHNNHITKMFTRNKSPKDIKKQDTGNINATPFEIHAIMQNIYEASQELKYLWEDLTFDELVEMLPSLRTIKSNMNHKEYIKWKKTVKRKMYKGGILGKNMRNT